jgi:hypothetical protein
LLPSPEETTWRSLVLMISLAEISPRLSKVGANGPHRRFDTDCLAGVSGVLHLASPLPGKLPPAEMLDVRIPHGTHLFIPS